MVGAGHDGPLGMLFFCYSWRHLHIAYGENAAKNLYTSCGVGDGTDGATRSRPFHTATTLFSASAQQRRRIFLSNISLSGTQGMALRGLGGRRSAGCGLLASRLARRRCLCKTSSAARTFWLW